MHFTKCMLILASFLLTQLQAVEMHVDVQPLIRNFDLVNHSDYLQLHKDYTDDENSDDYINDYDYDYDDNSDEVDNENENESFIHKNKSLARMLSQSALYRISETLGALNNVGHLLVNMTRGGQYSKPGTINETAVIMQIPRDEININYSLPLEYHIINKINSSSNQSVHETGIERFEDQLPKTISENKNKKNKKRIRNKKNKIKKPSIQLQIYNTTNTEETILKTTLIPYVEIKSTSSSSIYNDLGANDLSNKDEKNQCRTPSGKPGRCEDLSSCPALLLNLSSLRESLCFKSLFVPGVCCPIFETNATLITERPLKINTIATTVSSSITKKTTLRPTSTNLLLVPEVRPTIQVSSTIVSVTSNKPINIVDKHSNNIVNMRDCGQQEYSTGRIVGGVQSPNGQWPWMAAIFLHGPKRTEFWCGGSLIGSRYILTAAHCTRDSRQKPFAARQFTVRLGDIDLSTDSEPSDPVTFGVKEVRAHERFSRIGFYNDLAILVLDRPVRKSKYVIPVCLPTSYHMPTKHSLPGKRATVVGWGTTYYGGKESTNQRQAEIPIWRNQDCDHSYFQPINENFICAGYSDGGVDACQGDSGGPLMMHYASRWVQLGVVSFGNKCGEPGYPGVYTRISQYLDWIRDHTRD